MSRTISLACRGSCTMEDNNLAVEARRRLVRSSRHRQKTSTARAR